VRIVRSLNAPDVCEVLRSIFASCSLPEELVSDNGSPFSSRELAEFLRLNQIRHLTSPVCHPPNNGMVEKPVGTEKKSLEKHSLDVRHRTSLSTAQDWRTAISSEKHSSFRYKGYTSRTVSGEKTENAPVRHPSGTDVKRSHGNSGGADSGEDTGSLRRL